MPWQALGRGGDDPLNPGGACGRPIRSQYMVPYYSGSHRFHPFLMYEVNWTISGVAPSKAASARDRGGRSYHHCRRERFFLCFSESSGVRGSSFLVVPVEGGTPDGPTW
jgi:hypothetical protein